MFVINVTKGAVFKILSKLFKRLTTGPSSNCVTVLAPAVNYSSLLAIIFSGKHNMPSNFRDSSTGHH